MINLASLITLIIALQSAIKPAPWIIAWKTPTHNSQFTIHNSQFTIHNSQFTIYKSEEREKDSWNMHGNYTEKVFVSIKQFNKSKYFCDTNSVQCWSIHQGTYFSQKLQYIFFAKKILEFLCFLLYQILVLFSLTNKIFQI